MLQFLAKFFNKSYGYQSELDRFLQEFDKRADAHSHNRQQEEKKAAMVAQKRDQKHF